MNPVSTLARDTRLRLDSVAFAEHLGIVPDEWQADVLRNPARQLLLACARQVGKSTVCALLAAHEAVSRPNGLVILIAPSQRQSGELFRTVLDMLRRSGLERVTAESSQRCELANASRIVALPGSSETIRGLAGARLAVVDEAAFTPPELYAAITPMLATVNGRLILASSPAGTTGYFATAWRDGGDVWQRVRVRADECSRISPEFLARQRLMLTQQQYAAEFEAEFIEGAGSVFRAEDLARMHAEPVSGWEL